MYYLSQILKSKDVMVVLRSCKGYITHRMLTVKRVLFLFTVKRGHRFHSSDEKETS